MGHCIVAMILKTFDVGSSIKMWHFAAVFTAYLSKPKLAYIGVCHHYKVQKFKDCKYFVHECRLIGAEEPFITHCAEQCPSNWKGISYHRPTGSFIEYCFWEWLTPNCFVFARRETSEAEEIDSDWKWAAVGGFIYRVSYTTPSLLSILIFSLACEDGLLQACDRQMTNPLLLFAFLPKWGRSHKDLYVLYEWIHWNISNPCLIATFTKNINL